MMTFSNFAITGYVDTQAPPVFAGNIAGLSYWYRGLSNWMQLTDIPPAVPVGTELQLAVLWLNQSGVPISGHIEAAVTRPDGSSVTLTDILGQNNWATSGSTDTVLFAPVLLDQASTYTARVTLSTMGETLDERTVNIAEVQARGLLLHFSNPKMGAALWDTWALDLETKQTVIAEPSGIQELTVAKRLNLISKDFLLWVQEMPGYGQPGAYNFGPYVVSIPEFGEYTWNSREGSIDGQATTDLPRTSNESLVTGVLTGISQGTYGWMASISVTSTQAVGGKVDAAQYFVGTTITAEQASIPTDAMGNPVIEVGREITAHAQLFYGTYRAYWKAWDFTYVTGPQPTFSGSMWGEEIQPVEMVGGGYSDGITRVHYTVSGSVPQFRVLVALINRYGAIVQGGYEAGPTSGYMDVSTLYFSPYYGMYVAMYANPDLSAIWNPYSWQLNGWQAVASYGEWNY